MRAAWCEAELLTTAASSLPRQTEPTAPGGLGWAAPPGHCLGAAPHTATLLPLLRNSSTLHDSQIHLHVSKTSSFEHPSITHQKLHCQCWCWCTLLTVGKWRGGTLGQLGRAAQWPVCRPAQAATQPYSPGCWGHAEKLGTSEPGFPGYELCDPCSRQVSSMQIIQPLSDILQHAHSEFFSVVLL